MAPTRAESVGVLVKERDLVYERYCIKWLCIEGKIDTNITNGMYSTRVKH